MYLNNLMQFSKKFNSNQKKLNMLVFPKAKINLGLNIVGKRSDGFHNIESVFYNINWQDALEVVEIRGTEETEGIKETNGILGTKGEGIEIVNSGIDINSPLKENLIFKAFNLLKNRVKLPPLKVYLHKNIPMGAGLGGGSSDAASFLKLTNKKFELKLSKNDLKEIASQIGSDCAYFIENKPAFATQKGEILEPINLDLSKYYILLVYPNMNSNTKEAYEGVIPKKPIKSVKEIVLNEPLGNWKNILFNDFEKTIFKKYPEIENIKNTLYKNGAIYSAMSGSGSAVFGIFNEKPVIEFPKNYLVYFS